MPILFLFSQLDNLNQLYPLFIECIFSISSCHLSDLQRLSSEKSQLLEALGDTVHVEAPTTSSSWTLRQSAAREEWRKERSFHLDSLLSSRVVTERQCSHCEAPAVLRCRDCMPDMWLCVECDKQIHHRFVLHNRDTILHGFYKPIAPTVGLVEEEGTYRLSKQGKILIYLDGLSLNFFQPKHAFTQLILEAPFSNQSCQDGFGEILYINVYNVCVQL